MSLRVSVCDSVLRAIRQLYVLKILVETLGRMSWSEGCTGSYGALVVKSAPRSLRYVPTYLINERCCPLAVISLGVL